MKLREQVQEALRGVVDPCSIATGVPLNLIDMGMVRDIEIDADRVRITIWVTSPLCWQLTNIRCEVLDVVSNLPGVRSVVCDVDPAGEWDPSMLSHSAQQRMRQAPVFVLGLSPTERKDADEDSKV